MKTLIVYYSYSGNTRRVAEILGGCLETKGAVEIVELKALDENNNFFRQCNRAFRKVRAQIAEVNFDLSGYDLICLGTPVWAFSPAPAMNAYLDRCFGLEGKEVILFCTVGGSGMERCLNYMQSLLALKGARNFKRFFIIQSQVKDPDAVLSKIKAVIA
jgi:flavodoxin